MKFAKENELSKRDVTQQHKPIVSLVSQSLKNLKKTLIAKMIMKKKSDRIQDTKL